MPVLRALRQETEPALLRSYVDKGVLRIEWRNFPVFGAEEVLGLSQGCAYGEPRERNQGEFSQDRLVSMARQAGIADLDRFRSDMASDETRSAVSKDQEEGYGLGVTSTPAFLINGKPILGAQPTATFEQAIDAAAKAARR